MVKVVPVHSVKSVKGSGDIVPVIPSTYTGLRRAYSYYKWPPYLRRNKYWDNYFNEIWQFCRKKYLYFKGNNGCLLWQL